MENLLEELVGEIYDESDKERSSGIKTMDDGIEVDGGVTTHAASGELTRPM
ncbi:MAG: hypothetical protein GY809_24660 [Planctomycetes bacterium]|nr:hypothetical protein [Planctomycetota bacterium]